MRVIWEELESLTIMDGLSEMNSEVMAYVNAVYCPKRSQILLVSPLLGVDDACNMIQQEGNKREIIKQAKEESRMIAMSSKKTDTRCSNHGKLGYLSQKSWTCKACGKQDHAIDKCWSIVGYPNWFDKGEVKDSEGRKNINEEKSGEAWITEEERNAKILSEGNSTNSPNTVISLPAGQTSGIVGTGKVKLSNGIELRNVILIPSFQQNLLSIKKLSRDSNYNVMFLYEYCVIHGKSTSEVKGVGKARKGWYYLIDELIAHLVTRIKGYVEEIEDKVSGGQICKVMKAEAEMK
ncbi:Retrovirus-related Pol polyprotein from transposon RE2, partial [Bienertia sinuspersici]